MRRGLAASLLGLCCTVLVSPATAESPVAAGNGAPVAIRHLYLPVDEIAKWRGDGHVYQQVPRDEYERLVDQALRSDRLKRRPPPARILDARYSARLVDGDLRHGRAELEIASDTATDVPLSLAPLSVAVGEARWQKADRSRRAIVGAGPDGEPTLVVGPEDEHLRFSWSARGTRTQRGFTFSLGFPRATGNSLILELPKGFTPVPSLGVAEGPARSDGEFGRWTLSLGIHHVVELSILRDLGADKAEIPVRARQETKYDIFESDVVIRTQFELTVDQRRPEPFRLTLDEGVRVYDVQLGNLPLAWSVSEGDPREVRIELPEVMPEVGRVAVTARAAFEQGVLWQLPRIQAEDVFWETGTTKILVYHPLEIDEIRLDKCRIISSDRFAASADRGASQGRDLELQFFEPDASVQLVLGPLRGILQAKTAQILRWSADEYRLTSVTDWRLSAGRRFRVRYHVPAGWDVIGVETPDQPTRGQDWQLHPAADRPGQVLEVNLARSLSAESALHTVVRARRRQPGTMQGVERHRIPELVPLAADEHEGVIDFVVDGPYRASFERLDGLRAVDLNQPGEVGDEWRGLLPQRPRGDQFHFNSRRHDGWVRLVPKTAFSTSRVDGYVSLGSGEMTQRYKIGYEFSDADRSDRCLVYFSNSTNGKAEWSEGAVTGVPLPARVLRPENHPAWGVPSSGELWEVLLPSGRRFFEMTVQLRSPIEGDGSLNLPWPIGDPQPKAIVRVAQANEQPWYLDANGASLLPLSTLDASQSLFGPTSGVITHAFTYDRPDAEITARRFESQTERSQRVVWQSRLESLLVPAGVQRHRLSLQIEPHGSGTFSLVFAEGDRVRGAWVEGRPLEVSQTGTKLRLPLPRTSGPMEVVVEYEADRQPWSLLGGVTVSLPQTEVPVAAFDWRMAMPSGYELLRVPSGLRPLEPPHGKLTWTQRLFGPLGRPEGLGWFHPLDPAAWRSLFGQPSPKPSDGDVVWQAASVVEDFFGEAGGGTVPSLAALLRSLMSADAGLLPLLVDAAALEEDGWSPETSLVAANRNREAAALAPNYSLADTGLSMLVAPRGLVVTTSEELERLEPWLRASAVRGLYLVAPSPLAHQIHAVVQSDAVHQGRFQHVLDWMQTAARFAGSGASADGQTFAERARGWDVVRLTGMDMPHTVKLRFAARRQIAFLGASLFLLALLVTMATSGRAPRRRRIGLIAVPLVAWSLALIVPGPITPLCTGVALGVVAAGTLNALRARRREGAINPSHTQSTMSTILRPATMGVLVAATAWLGRGAWAQQADETGTRPSEVLAAPTQPSLPASAPDSESDPNAKLEYFVLIPSNGDGREDEEAPVYVPTELLDRLRRDAREPPPAYVLAAGQYEGSMTRQQALVQLRVDVFVYGARVPVSVVVPIDPQQLVPGTAQLDGEAIRPVPLGAGVGIRIAEPGLHELEFRLRAPVRGGLDGLRATFHVPALPQSSLLLHLPEPQAKLDVLNSRGPLHPIDADKLEAELGPVENLSLQWFDQAPAKAGEARVRLRQETLWDVQPASVEVEAHFHYRVVEGAVEQLHWLLNSPLQVKKIGPESLVADFTVEPVAGARKLLTIQLASPLSGELDLEAEFVLDSVTGIGNLWLPCLVPLGVEQDDAVLAFLGNPQIVTRVTRADGVTAIPAGDFLDRWGDEILNPIPERAFRVDGRRVFLSLSTRPREPVKTVEEHLLLRARRDRIDLVLDADMLTQYAPSFQHHFRVPPEVQIDSISVTEGGAQRLNRWSRNDRTGEVTLFLTQPTLGQQRVRIAGWLPTSLQGEMELPRVQSAEASLTTGRIYVAPDEEISVELDPSEHLEPVPITDDELAGQEDWIAAAYRFEVPEYSARIRLIPNVPQVQALGRLTVSRRGEAWHLDSEILYRVERGRVHRFVLRLPPTLEWGQRNVITTGVEAKVVPSGSKGRLLALVPAQPVEGEFRVRLEGMFAESAAQTVAVPNLRPEGVTRLEQYLVLPEGRDSANEPSPNAALKRAVLPSALAARSESAPMAVTYRATEPDWQAEIPFKSPRGGHKPVLLSADARVALGSHGTVWGEAVYVMLLSSRWEFHLDWPREARLCGVTLNGRRAAAKWDGTDRLAVALPAAVFPQRVAVRWQADLSNRFSGVDWVEVQAPMPKGAPVVKTWWTIRGPNGFRQFGVEGETTGAGARDLERLEEIVIEERRIARWTASRTEWADHVDLIGPWLLRFDREVSRLRPRLASAASAGSAQARSSLGRMNEIIEDQRQFEQRLGDKGAFGGANPFKSLTGSSDTRLAVDGGSSLAVSPFGRTNGTLGFWNVRAGLLDGMLRGAWIVAMTLAGWVTFRVSLRPISPEQNRVRNGVLGTAVGVAWWWWLEPSAVGLLIAAVSVLATGWVSWRVRGRQDDSFVVIVAR